MALNTHKLLGVANKVKTPVALSAMVVLVLYAIYRQVLNLKVFSNIGSDPTFRLLQNVIDKMFWLALSALLLGVISYIVTFIFKKRMLVSRSAVTIIDASLDHKDSAYEQTIQNGKKTIRPQRSEEAEGGTND